MMINHSLVPGLPTVQFLIAIACSMQKQRGRPGPFYHVNDISVYLGRQRGGGGGGGRGGHRSKE